MGGEEEAKVLLLSQDISSDVTCLPLGILVEFLDLEGGDG